MSAAGDPTRPDEPDQPASGDEVSRGHRDEQPEPSMEVSLRKEAEQKLGAVHERLQMTLAAANDYAFLVMDTEGRIVSWNAGASNIFGWSEDEILDQPFARLFTEEDREQGIPDKELEKAAAAGVADDNRWHVRKDGSRFWGHGVTTALKNDTIRGFAKLVRDLTHEKMLEEAVRESEARYRKLSEELAAANEQKNHFLAVLSHELRNPLAPIRSASELIRTDPTLSPVAEEACGILQRQVEVMVRLVNDLLEVSRITSGKVRLQKKMLSVQDILRQAVEAIRAQFEGRTQQLSVSVPDEPVLLHADPVRIEQVVVNLLTNASKYTPEGGRIWLSVEQKGNIVELSVRDSGEGIAPDVIPNVFTMFSQAGRSLNRSEGGLGVGLALVKSLVELHEGAVEARSAGIGRGSEFLVRLPVSEDSTDGDEPVAEAESQPAALRILVVDDNADAARMLAMILSARGFAVREENSGAAGLQAARQFRPHVILLDIGMPGMDGFEFARQIRRQPELESVRLIAVTGHGLEINQQQSQEAGIDHHLTKPVEGSTLLNLLDQIRPSLNEE